MRAMRITAALEVKKYVVESALLCAQAKHTKRYAVVDIAVLSGTARGGGGGGTQAAEAESVRPAARNNFGLSHANKTKKKVM